MNETVDDKLLHLSIDELMLSGRAHRALEHLGVEVIGDIIGKTEVELLRMSNVGKATVREIKHALRDFGVYVMGEEPPLSATEKAEAIIQFARIVRSISKEDLIEIFTHGRIK